MMRSLILAIVLLALPAAKSQNATNLPVCASGCIGHATAAAESCSNMDQKCLCTNDNYINELSCCLATACDYSDQQLAIQYNIASCNAVNESAPNFVGCSPLGISSSVPSFDTNAMSSSTSMSMDMGTSMDLGGGTGMVTTVSGSVVALATAFVTASTIIVKTNAKSLLVGKCTNLYFAAVTDTDGSVTEYPEIGCSNEQPDCCPFGYQENGILQRCPLDYTTTAGACCPSGWQLYFTELGGQTPCFTMPAITYIPAATPTITGVTIITEHVFTRKYDLAKGARSAGGLSTGAKAGVAIGPIIGALAILVGAALLWRRRKAQSGRNQTEQGTEKSLPQSPPAVAYELPSPGPLSHLGSPNHLGPLTSHGMVPAYIVADPTSPTPVVEQPPQELPGSYFLHENHPAFTPAASSHVESSVNDRVATMNSPEGIVSPVSDSPIQA